MSTGNPKAATKKKQPAAKKNATAKPKSEPRKKPGPPPSLTDDQVIEIINFMVEGNGCSLKDACLKANKSYWTIVCLIGKSDNLTNALARAREEYQHLRVQQMNDIALNEPDVQRARLMCDNIKWEAARIASKHYGDKQQVDVTQRVEMTIEQVDEKINQLLSDTKTDGRSR